MDWDGCLGNGAKQGGPKGNPVRGQGARLTGLTWAPGCFATPGIPYMHSTPSKD